MNQQDLWLELDLESAVSQQSENEIQCSVMRRQTLDTVTTGLLWRYSRKLFFLYTWQRSDPFWRHSLFSEALPWSPDYSSDLQLNVGKHEEGKQINDVRDSWFIWNESRCSPATRNHLTCFTCSVFVPTFTWTCLETNAESSVSKFKSGPRSANQDRRGRSQGKQVFNFMTCV